MKASRSFLVASALSVVACTPPSGAGECFVDAQCPADMACVAGECSMSGESEGEEDTMVEVEKLDVGGGIGNATSCEAASFVATNAGCEFWGVDLPNIWHPSTPYSLDVATDQQFAIVVANVSETDDARVTVFEGDGSSAVEEAIVGPLGTYAFMLPNDLQLDPERNDGGRAFRVESDIPITAYQFQPLSNLVPVYSNDATSLLPAHVLQSDYIAVSDVGRLVTTFPNGWTEQAVPAGAYVTVVATEDDTHVQFYPTDVLASGPWEGVTLMRGDAYTILSDPANEASIDGNLSGTRVISDRPVAAFSGNVAASVPSTATECCLDHLEHQLLPTVAWGSRYVAAPPPDPSTPSNDDPSVIRIVGAHDDTALVYPAGKPAGAPDTIDAHQEIAFSTTEPLIIEAEDPGKPFSVSQYLYNSGEANSGGELGDPGMIVLPAIEQLMDRYVFLAPHGYRTSVATIVAPSGTEVTLDGESVGGWSEIGDSGGQTWAYARAEIEPGAHVVSSDAAAQVTIVGYDVTVSYAFAGGSAVEAINDAPPAP